MTFTDFRYDVHIKVKEVDSNHDTSIVENQVSTKAVAPKNGEENGRTTTVQLDEVVSKHSSMEQGGTTPKYNELLNNSLVTPADSKLGGIDGQHSKNSTDASNFTALSLVEDIPSDNGTAHPNKANQTIVPSTTKDLSDVVALLISNDNEENNKHNDSTDRKSTRLNSSHTVISYAVFCLKKKNFNLSTLCFYNSRPPPTNFSSSHILLLSYNYSINNRTHYNLFH